MDMALESTNLRGKYQFILSVIVIFYSLTVFLISAGYPYLTLIPDILCQSKLDESLNQNNNYASCEMELYCNVRNSMNMKIDMTTTLDNFALKYELYCNRNSFSSLINSAFFLGAVAGVIVCASYPDTIGRLPVLKALLIINMVNQINMLIGFNVYHIILCSFFSGFCTFSNSVLSFLIIEKMDETWSAIIMSARSAAYGLVGVIVGFYYLFINNLKLLLIINIAISALCYYLTITYLVESPRWLMSKNRIEESIECLRGMARVNGSQEQLETFLTVNSEIIKTANKETTVVKESLTLLQIFQLKSQQIRVYTLAYTWFFLTAGVIGYYASLNQGGGNVIVAGIMSFTAEFVAEMSSGILANFFGRIFMLEILIFLGGASFIIAFFLGDNIIKTLLQFMVSFGLNGAINLLYIYTNEIFPISIKGLTFSFMYLISRLGGATAPIFLKTSLYPLIFGGLSISSGFLVGRLEETLGRKLEDDVPEAVRTYSAFSSFKVSNEQKMHIQKSFNLGKNKPINQDYFKLTDDHSEIGNLSDKP